MRSIAIILSGLLTLTALPAWSQNTGDGTIYSRYGIGELRTFGSTQVEALGGAGFALRSLNYVNLDNPASWGNQLLTRAFAGLRYQNLRARADGQDESVLSEGNLSAVGFSFPVLDQKLGIALGMQPYSRVSYRVQLAGRTPTDPFTEDSTDYRIDYEGSGGLQQILGGAGYQLNPRLSLGAAVHFIFGILDYGRETSFPGSFLSSTNLTTSTRMTGIGGSFGGLYQTTGLFRPTDAASIGITFKTPVRLSARRVTRLGESLDADTLVAPLRGDVTLPLSVGAGLGYRPDNRWLFTANASFEPWTSFESDLPFAGTGNAADGVLNDRFRFSAGAEVLPGGTDAMASFVSRVAYRLGAYVDRSYVTPRGGVAINVMALTGGVSIPTMLTGTRLDINFEVGTRGTTEHELVQDLFYRLSVNVNVGERWFQRQRLR